MSEIKNLLAKMINKINRNEDRIDNIEENGVGGGVSSWNDLTDKPFGETEAEVEKVYFDFNGNIEIDTSFNKVYASFIELSDKLIAGQSYNITYNGVLYENCVAIDTNGTISVECNTENGYVKIYDYIDQSDWLAIQDTTGDEENLTISVKVTSMTKDTVIKRLDGKYLPEGYPYVEKGEMVEILRKSLAENITEDDVGLSEPLGLIVGKEYIVNWAGIDYRCVAKLVSIDSDNDAIAIGNSVFSTGKFDNVPFIIVETVSPVNGFYGFAQPIDESLLPVEFSVSFLNGSTIEVLPETEVEIDEDGLGGIERLLGLKVGETYNITYNGVSYTSIAIDGSSLNPDSVGQIVIGNIDLIMGSGDSGTPFVLVETANEDMQGIILIMADGTVSTTITIAISQDREIVHTIDPKYLPEGLPYTENDENIIEIFPETNIAELISVNGNTAILSFSDNLVARSEYTVIVNGIRYVRTAVEITLDGLTGIVIGNYGLLMGGEDTGEPFVVMQQGDTQGYFVITPPEEDYLKVAIYQGGGGEIVHKMDNKYLDLDWLPTKKIEHAVVFADDIRLGTQKEHTFSEKPFDFIKGEAYTINYDGTEYKCVAKSNADWTGAGYKNVFIGNISLAGQGDDTGEPFVFTYVYNNEDIYTLIGTVGDQTVSVSVQGIVAVYDKMPEEFLPEGYRRENVYIDLYEKYGAVVDVNASLIVENVDTEKLFSCLDSGNKVILRFLVEHLVTKTGITSSQEVVAVFDGSKVDIPNNTFDNYHYSTISIYGSSSVNAITADIISNNTIKLQNWEMINLMNTAV